MNQEAGLGIFAEAPSKLARFKPNQKTRPKTHADQDELKNAKAHEQTRDQTFYAPWP